MKQKIVSLGILLALVVGAGLSVNQIKTNPKATISASSSNYATTTVKVGAKSFQVELAVTTDQQSLGLGQRDSLAANNGMLFVFKPAEAAIFWMKDMRFPLDMIWVYQGRIVAISHNVPVPKAGTANADLPTYSPKILIDYVLEVNAGAASGLNVDDQFELANSTAV